jgi:hypothetical protein
MDRSQIDRYQAGHTIGCTGGAPALLQARNLLCSCGRLIVEHEHPCMGSEIRTGSVHAGSGASATVTPSDAAHP